MGDFNKEVAGWKEKKCRVWTA